MQDHSQPTQQLFALMRDYASLVKKPVTSDELSSRGCELQAIGNTAKAMAYFEEAIVADPASARAHFNRAQLLARQSAHEEALPAYRMAAMLGLNLPDLDHNIAMSLYWLYRPQQALQYCDRALRTAAKESRAIMLNSRCLILMDLDRPDEALLAAKEAVELSPDFHMARLNRALAHLTLGKWHEGWEDYEARWHGAHEAQQGVYTRPPIPLPQWQGQTVPAGQGIFVYTEQGLGDTLQFVRYLKVVKQRFSHVTFACPDAIFTLLQHSFSDLEIRFQTLEKVHFDLCHWQCPLLSLPFALRETHPEPFECGPYIRAQAQHLPRWAEKLRALPANKLKVGLCWAGSPTLRRDAQRSIAFEHLQPLLERTDMVWISLQKSDDKAAQYRGSHPNLLDWSEGFTDLSQTAALIEQLDLVICVDTSVAHLAAAMGKPVWLLCRFEGEWRWLHQRNDSPWYASLRLFRQSTHLQWTDVMARVGVALDHLQPAAPAQSHHPSA